MTGCHLLRMKPAVTYYVSFPMYSLPRSAIFLALLLISSRLLQGMVVYESVDATGTTFNTTPPGNGAPWAHVARYDVNGNPNASAVWMGNRFVLTANHVTESTGASIHLGGVNYSRDTSYPYVRIPNTDLKVFRILPHPNSGLPVLPKLRLVLPTEQDLSAPVTFIAWGEGKGAVVSGSGWYRSGQNHPLTAVPLPSARAQRWGTNTTAATFSSIEGAGEQLRTSFVRVIQGPNDRTSPTLAQGTMGDSGSGLFSNYNGVWKMIGVTRAVTDPTRAFYSPGDITTFTRVRTYARNLRFENWAAAELGNPLAPPDGDPNGDGIPHLLDYAFGGSPQVPDSAERPVVAVDSLNASITFSRNMTATDLEYEVMVSEDLVKWDPPETSTSAFLDTTGLQRRQRVTVPLNGRDMLFLRVEVKLIQ